jgi:hypothetical protein
VLVTIRWNEFVSLSLEYTCIDPLDVGFFLPWLANLTDKLDRIGSGDGDGDEREQKKYYK